MSSLYLKLNLSKTELLVFSPSTNLPLPDIAISVCGSTITPKQHARCLGVILDSDLSFTPYIRSLARSSYLHLKNISRIRPFLTFDSAKTLTVSLIHSRLDYCNSLLIGLPLAKLSPLQSVLNAAARIIFLTNRYTDASTLCQSLHWLPIHSRIQYKTTTLIHKALHGSAPPYISSLVSVYHPTRALRSANDLRLASSIIRTSHSRLQDFTRFFKASFLPLLEFAYTSELCFDFCSMAELVMLARHLYMHEVLEICESVHKQMEEKQLTLYQKGGVHTVALDTNVEVIKVGEAGNVSTPKLSIMKEVESGQQILTVWNVKCPGTQDIIASAASQPNSISTTLSVDAVELTNGADIPVDSVDTQVGSIDGTTAIYISNSADVQPDVLLPTIIDVISLAPQQTIENVQDIMSEMQVSSESLESQPSFTNVQGSEAQEMPSQGAVEEQVDLARNTQHSEVTHPLDAQGSPCMDVDVNEEKELESKAIESLKRKRGKTSKSIDSPADIESAPTIPDDADEASSEGAAVDRPCSSKVDSQSSGTDTTAPESPGSSEMDPYKSKLRERSVGEGEYVQLHRGKDKKNCNRKSIPKSAVQQAARKLVQRGKKIMLPPKKDAPDVEEHHTCKECGMIFQRKYAMIMHSMSHDHIKKFKCPTMKGLLKYI
ncbi:unnamed protein product [Ranitomeya imitator]|uniref:C2H2-type domain-containing protein n=1 Tax=Ranitomeya imitator TaxID=111125 RepID=A0ABN9L170_9NEOB|nr:unnamed protein product [Ranitomeya imitator]